MSCSRTESELFPCKLVEASRLIREGYPISTYNHRFNLPDQRHPWDLEQFRLGYACFKREVAKVLQPKIILEIGVGIGISAMAFMDACPSSYYLGIDSDVESGRDFPVQPSLFVYKLLASKSYSFDILKLDSQKMNSVPAVPDFVHIDACHSRKATEHDVTLAWNALAPSGFILVDDARDSNVSAGTFDALAKLHPGSIDWTYFEDTWTGSILIHREQSRP